MVKLEVGKCYIDVHGIKHSVIGVDKYERYVISTLIEEKLYVGIISHPDLTYYKEGIISTRLIREVSA